MRQDKKMKKVFDHLAPKRNKKIVDEDDEDDHQYDDQDQEEDKGKNELLDEDDDENEEDEEEDNEIKVKEEESNDNDDDDNSDNDDESISEFNWTPTWIVLCILILCIAYVAYVTHGKISEFNNNNDHSVDNRFSMMTMTTSTLPHQQSNSICFSDEDCGLSGKCIKFSCVSDDSSSSSSHFLSLSSPNRIGNDEGEVFMDDLFHQ